MRALTTSLDNILSLISCAADYGFEDDVLFEAFSGIIGGHLSDDEIQAYAKSESEKEGCTNEDFETIKSRLTEFKIKYINQTKQQK